MATRWARGFLRLWVVASFLWVGVVALVGLMQLGIPSFSNACELPRKYRLGTPHKSVLLPDLNQCEAIWRQELANLAEWAVLPPVVSLVIVLVLVWALRGLRS
jgi:hypothetical protein